MKKAVDRIGEFNRFGSVLGLERMTELLERLDHPERGLNVIHVAGTNGKGSVCTFVSSVLVSAGYTTGIFSSPAMESFSDRITIQSPEKGSPENISDEDLEKHTEAVMNAVDGMISDGYDSPTEFEVVTAIGFLYFSERDPDFVVLEVGLGGRGDSTNVIEEPLVTVVTSIDLDHTDRLGDTLSEIAGEKAGIARKDVPMISNAVQPEAVEVIRAASDIFVDIGGVVPYNISVGVNRTCFSIPGYEDLCISMTGRHQCENAKTAVAVIDSLRERGLAEVSDEDIYKGLSKAFRSCRFEVFDTEGPLVILDGAHNPAGAERFAETLRECMGLGSERPKDRLVFTLAVLKDKNIEGMAERFLSVSREFDNVTFIATEADSDRTMPSEILSQYFRESDVIALKDRDDAVRKAFELAGNGVIVFAGSLYLLGDIRGTVIKICEELTGGD